MSTETKPATDTTGGAAGAALAALINPEALRQIIVEAARRGDVKVSIPGDVVRKILGDQCEAAAKIVGERVAVLAEELAKKIARNVSIKLPERKAVTIKNPHRQTPELIKLLESLRPNMRNVALIGPAASGKSTAAEHAAEALGFESAIVQGQVLTRYDFDGFVDAHGVYHATPFRRFCESESGGVFGQDEMDSCEPKALLGLNQYLANGKVTFPDGKTFKRTDRHYVVASLNTWGGGANRIYVGRNQLDGASRDRYRPMVWDYDEELESQLVANESWHSRVKIVRRAVDALKLRHTITPRDAMRGADEIAAGSTIAEQEKIQLKRDLPDTDWTKVLAQKGAN